MLSLISETFHQLDICSQQGESTDMGLNRQIHLFKIFFEYGASFDGIVAIINNT